MSTNGRLENWDGGLITGSMVQRLQANWIRKAETSGLSEQQVSRVGAFSIFFSFPH